MKAIKGLVLFCFLSIGISACFNPPEFKNTPEITFREVYFQRSNNPEFQDSIVLRFDFRDGDGDLGLPLGSLPPPYNVADFYVENGSNTLVSAGAYLTDDFSFLTPSGVKKASNGLAPGLGHFVLNIPTGQKLATFYSRSHGYPSLPPFASPYSTCQRYDYYYIDTVYIAKSQKAAVRKSKIVDSLLSTATSSVLAYGVLDTFYVAENFNQYNMLVKFYQKVGNTYQEFDWRKQFCLPYDSKFVIFSDSGSPVEGTLTFSMKSFGFEPLFGVRSLYIEFQIIDQALNRSNIERTREFTLIE
jgi:hypothetical protein